MGQSSSVALENLLESDFWCIAEWQRGGEQVFGGRQKLLCRQDALHVLITVDSDSGLELWWNIVQEQSSSCWVYECSTAIWAEGWQGTIALQEQPEGFHSFKKMS